MIKNKSQRNRVATGAASALTAGLISVGALTAQASTDYGPAIWNPLPDYYTSGNGHKFHVVHDMEGYYHSVKSVLQNQGLSVHYAVNGKKDASSDANPGEISQFVRDANYAIHARCWNTHSTGTEHEGFASNPAWYTDELYVASAGITRHLSSAFGWAKDRNHVVGHNGKSSSAWVSWASGGLGIDPTCNTHGDPGSYWDWSYYMSLVNGASASTICDFTGDGKTDFSVFRNNGTWHVRSGEVNISYGNQPGDIPVPGPYLGNGKSQFAVFRSNGTWFVRGGEEGVSWGNQPGDIPVPGDYLGTGKFQFAVFRPSNGTWHVRGGEVGISWGNQPGDIPVPGPYLGNGKWQMAVFRPSNGTWHVRGGEVGVSWGNQPGDVPVPGDYLGTGKWQFAVFRNNGTWHVRGGEVNVSYGNQPGDIPVPGQYLGNGKEQFAVFRANGTWFVRGGEEGISYGNQPGDIPTPLPYAIRHVFY